MFSYFGNQSKDMAFRTDGHEFARTEAACHLSKTLNAYLDGQEKAYALTWAIGEIEALFGVAGTLPVKMLRDMMQLHADDPRRLREATEAVQMIERQLRKLDV